jgi:Rrf2 family transcriptional regulator, nitric oxide-sensitive transcriptional repressor
MKISKSTDLAIHGLWQLAADSKRLHFVSEMAKAQRVSESYLAKIFQRLARRGLVRSLRGKRGGFALAKVPEKISLAEVVRAVESDGPLYSCLGPERGCKGYETCNLKRVFRDVEDRIYSVLGKTSLADLCKSNGSGARRSWML